MYASGKEMKTEPNPLPVQTAHALFGLPPLDSLVSAAARPLVLYLQGNPGSGRESFAAHFAAQCGDTHVAWIGVNVGAPRLPRAQREWWASAVASGTLHPCEIDAVTAPGSQILAGLQEALAGRQFARAVVLNADLLALAGDQTLCVSVIQLLRRHVPVSMLVGTLPSIGGPLDLSPPGIVALSDALLATRIALPAGSGLTLDVIKTPHPGGGLPLALHYAMRDSGVHFVDAPVRQPSARQRASESSAAVPVSERFVVMPEMFYVDPDEERLVTRRVAEVNRANEDAHFVLPDTRFASSIDYNNRFEEFKLGRRQWDFFVADVYRLGELMERDLIWPLDEFLTDEWRAKYLPVALEQCTLDGRTWALPHWINPGVMVCRADLLDRHGMAPPATWDELVSHSQFLQKRERVRGFRGFAFSGAQFEALTCAFLEFLWNTGGDVHDASTRAVFDSRAGTEALQFMIDLVHRHRVAPPQTPDLSESQTTRLFLDGQLAFVRNWPQMLAEREGAEALRAGRVSLAPLPTATADIASRSVLGGFCFVIPRHVRAPEELMRFYREFHTPEMIRELAVRGWTCSPFAEAYTDPRVLRTRPWYAAMPELLAAARPRKSVPHYGRLTSLVRREVNLALRRIREPGEALRIIASELQQGIHRQVRELRMQKVIDHIRSNLHEDISRDRMAAMCRLSPSYFSTLFRETIGCSFARYVNELRIERARDLLETSELTIAEIAEQVGYSDHSYFCHVFREATQMAPTQYRLNALSRTSHH